jgi:hypothetical protein
MDFRDLFIRDLMGICLLKTTNLGDKLTSSAKEIFRFAGDDK